MEPIEYPTTVSGMVAHLRSKLADTVPPYELRMKAELAVDINRVKKEKNAIILGHNYMEPALFHSVPDYTGDSLELSRIAASSEADIIVFCGVKFMAETAKILNPERTVLLPSPKGGCSLAESITAEEVRKLREMFPGAPVVTYVNTYADVKAECDYCCTSSNSALVVRKLLDEGADRVVFLPDEYLGRNTADELGVAFHVARREENGGISSEPLPDTRPVVIGWQGRCEVHEQFTVEDVENARKQFPDVFVLAHPECPPEVIEASDFSGSTSAMIRRVQEMDGGRYLLLTECSMGDNIVSSNPKAEMIRLCSVRCPHMGEITLEQTLGALLMTRYQIDVPSPVRERARRSLERMIEILPKR